MPGQYQDLVDFANSQSTAAPSASPPAAPTQSTGGQYQDLVEFANAQNGGTPPPQTPETDRAASAASSTFGFGPPRTQEQYLRLHGRGLTAPESNARWQKFMRGRGTASNPGSSPGRASNQH